MRKSSGELDQFEYRANVCVCVSVQACEAVKVAVGISCEEELGGGRQLRYGLKSGNRRKLVKRL